MTKKEKISFIMSSRYDEIKNNDTFYRYLFNQYLKMDNEELNIDFNYYYNNWKETTNDKYKSKMAQYKCLWFRLWY